MSSNSNNPRDTKEEHAGDGQASERQQGDSGHTGEGAASAMAHMISRGEQQRHQAGEADDAAGSNRS